MYTNNRLQFNNKLKLKNSINNITTIWKDIENNDLERLNDYWISNNNFNYQDELDELKNYFNDLIKKLDTINSKMDKADFINKHNFK